MIRTSSFVVLLAGAALAAPSGCESAPAMTVMHARSGEKVQDVDGDPLKLRRPSQEAYAGLRAGYFVVRGPEDWQNAWPEGKAPPLPATLDVARQMLLLGVAGHKDVAKVEIKRAVETANAVHVWVKETGFGEGCPKRLERTPFDAVVAPRVDKPVRVYVDDDPGESCGAPPIASVQCRQGEAREWSTDLTASPGDTIDCEMKAESRGKFALVDHVLTLAELPGGSTAKLAYAKGPVRGAFTVDVFGVYTIRAEATDDSGRKTSAVAKVTAAPPRSKDVLVAIVWSNFDVSDDPSTFPRLRVQTTDVDARGQKVTCASDDPTPVACDVKARGSYINLRLGASDHRVPLDVTYVDERVEKGPLVCVQLWFDGKRTAESCDRKARSAGDAWAAGTIDMATGALLEPQLADAGAPDAAADASSKAAPKATPKPAAPKKK